MRTSYILYYTSLKLALIIGSCFKPCQSLRKVSNQLFRCFLRCAAFFCTFCQYNTILCGCRYTLQCISLGDLLISLFCQSRNIAVQFINDRLVITDRLRNGIRSEFFHDTCCSAVAVVIALSRRKNTVQIGNYAFLRINTALESCDGIAELLVYSRNSLCDTCIRSGCCFTLRTGRSAFG